MPVTGLCARRDVVTASWSSRVLLWLSHERSSGCAKAGNGGRAWLFRLLRGVFYPGKGKEVKNVSESVEKTMGEVFGRFVAWGSAQPDGAAFLVDVDIVEAAVAGRYEGAATQACDAALRVANAAAQFQPEGLLAWAFVALVEVWMLHDGGL